MMLERLQHEHATFVTLTYSDDNIPLQDGAATLAPADLQNFLKRLRTHLAPSRIRFFAVGEYGDRTQRPHYHLIIYGLPTCKRSRTNAGLPATNSPATCCHPCKTLHYLWGLGRIFQGSVTAESCQYVAGYTVKKMTSADDSRLKGRHPEFTRMSLRPGIGAWALEDVALTLQRYRLAEQTDVPHSLMHGRRSMPLGRYLRQQLRLAMGKEKNAPSTTLDEAKEKMRPLRDYAFANSRSITSVVLETFKGQNDSLDAKLAIYERKKPL